MDFLWQFLTEKGISTTDLDSLKYLVLLLLLLPIVATLIGIARYIIGLRSLSFYVPLLVTFVFFEISYADRSNPDFLTGLIYGLIAFALVFLTSTVLYAALKRLRMHYIPKLSLIVVATSLAMMTLILLSIYFGLNIFLAVTPLTIIILAVCSEGFMAVFAKKNFRYTLSIAFETLIISIFSFLVISSIALQNFVLQYPWLLIIILVVINIYVGRFLGLRLTEYWRFKNILLQEETVTNEPTNTNTPK